MGNIKVIISSVILFNEHKLLNKELSYILLYKRWKIFQYLQKFKTL